MIAERIDELEAAQEILQAANNEQDGDGALRANWVVMRLAPALAQWKQERADAAALQNALELGEKDVAVLQADVCDLREHIRLLERDRGLLMAGLCDCDRADSDDADKPGTHDWSCQYRVILRFGLESPAAAS